MQPPTSSDTISKIAEAIIAGFCTLVVGALAFFGGRHTNRTVIETTVRHEASEDLRALVVRYKDEVDRQDGVITRLSDDMSELSASVSTLSDRLDAESDLRKAAEHDRDNCIGALNRERLINEGQVMAIDTLTKSLTETQKALDEANAGNEILRNAMLTMTSTVPSEPGNVIVRAPVDHAPAH